MKLFSNLAVKREQRSTEVQLSLRDPALKDFLSYGHQSIAGAHVTPENALRITGWFACVRIISSAIGKTPFITYRRGDQGKGKERATAHPVYGILHDQPNPFMTPMEWKKAVQAHLLGWGNGFNMIERNGGGQIIGLWPMHPSRVRLQVMRAQNRIWYYYRLDDGSEIQMSMDDVLHIRGMSSDGILGYSPVDLMREALGLAKVEEEYRSRFFKNDARPGAIVEYDGRMSDEAFKRFKADWQETYSGLGNKYKIGFLEAGLHWHDVGVPPQAAEFIEGRRFQLEELARITGVPLVLLQSTEKSTTWGTGVAEIKRAFLENCLLDWFVEWEERCNISLFTPTERKAGLFCEHELKNFLRGDPKSEAEVLEIMWRNSALSANEWRSVVNLNPLPGNLGDKYFAMTNMATVDQIVAGLNQKQEQQTPPAPSQSNS